MTASSNIRKSIDLAARSVFPAAIIIFTVLIMISVAVIWSGRRTSTDGAELERQAARSSLGSILASFEARLYQAVWTDTETQADAALASLTVGVDALERLDIVGELSKGKVRVVATSRQIDADRALPTAEAILAHVLGEIGRGAGTGPPALAAAHAADARLVRSGSDAFISVLIPRSDGSVAFGLRRLDSGFITALSSMTGLPGLRLEFDPSDLSRRNAVDLGLQGTPIGIGLIWNGRNLGGQMLHDVLPVVIFGACILFFFSVLIFLHIRRMIAEMLAAEQYAKHLAGHDPLTGLANRTSFLEQLRKELARLPREDTGVAVMFIDLDKFKEVNDTLGHAAGDKLLISVSRRLSEKLRGSDTIARLGGDEFAIVQTQVRGLRDVEALARRLIETVQEPFDLEGAEAFIGLSIGIVLAPENGTIAEDLIRFADVALYRSKQGGRNRFSFFEARMDDSVRMRKIVENDLRLAINQDDMQLLYQPQVSADGSRICAVEALVRWNHPTQGLIAPDRFIPLAEERGLIVPLGEWVMRRALEDARHWPEINVSINVSAVQFKQRDFVTTVARVLQETGFDPQRLEIELTESIVVDDADGAEEAMMELRAMGVRLALDDFGTGYSSLIYLRRFAFDKIKIDKSFLESMEATGESAILVHSVVHLGRALGLTVTAEGVETDEQQRFLQAVGCHQLQGFYFSRPVTATEIGRMLEQGQVGPAAAA